MSHGLHGPLGFCFPLHKIGKASLKLLSQPTNQQNPQESNNKNELEESFHNQRQHEFIGPEVETQRAGGLLPTRWRARRHMDLDQHEEEGLSSFPVVSLSKGHGDRTSSAFYLSLRARKSLPAQCISSC